MTLRDSLLTLSTVLAVGCASSTLSLQPTSFGRAAWQHQLSERGADPEVAVYPFEATPEMVEWAHRRIDRYTTLVPSQRLVMLQSALFNPREFNFDYDETLTLTAAEAFEQRRGNCLSFTALFITISRALGMPTFLVLVERVPEVEKDANIVVVNRHVVAGFRETGKMHIYDFYETSEEPHLHRSVVDDVWASAMFHTNLGAEAIRSGDLDVARKHLEVATKIAPAWPAGWINLGVASSRNGELQLALEAYQEALEVDRGNSSALTNMALAYQRMGMDAAARAALRAAVQGPSSPFTLIALADAEMAQGQLSEAARFLRRARRAYGSEPDVYEALARLSSRSGDTAKAERYSRRAAHLRAAAVRR